jgi:hypothetical protein
VNLQQLALNVKEIDLSELVSNIVTENKDYIIELLQSQLQQGRITSKGLYKKIKNKEYREIKLQQNPEAEGNWDLKFTGDLYSSMAIDVNPEEFKIIATDSKLSKLEDIFRSNDLLGLDDESVKDLLFKTIIPFLRLKIYEKLTK